MDEHGGMQPPLHAPDRCRRCGFHGRSAGTGSRRHCRSCGHDWQVLSAEVSQREVPDDLGTASLTTDRIRRFLRAPQTPAERAEAERRLTGWTRPT